MIEVRKGYNNKLEVIQYDIEHKNNEIERKILKIKKDLTGYRAIVYMVLELNVKKEEVMLAVDELLKQNKSVANFGVRNNFIFAK